MVFCLKVESREREIERLNKLLEGGRPVDAVVKDVKQGSSNKVLAHLNIQVSDIYYIIYIHYAFHYTSIDRYI